MISASRTGKRAKRTGKRAKRTPESNISISSPSPYQTSSSSAETVENNDDLLTQFLVCLPIKSLLKFKCVSRRWLSLITNPSFSLRIDSNPKPISGLFLHNTYFGRPKAEYEFISLDGSGKSSTPPFVTLKFADHPTDMIILQSCNGLLLCRCSCPNQTQPNYYIYNPTTKRNTLLPPFNGRNSNIYDVCLAFDPLKSPHFKVICLRSSGTSIDQYQMEIYSSNTGPWRLSGSPFTLPFHIEFRNRVSWNNAVHWIGHWGDCLSFDIEKEKIQVTPTPPVPEDFQTRSFMYFGESRGHLHLVDLSGLSSSQFWVYEMERDCSGWFPKYHVDLEPASASFPEIIRRDDYEEAQFYAFSVLCVVREDNDEDSYMVLQIPKKAIRYNFKDKTFKKICDFTVPDYEDSPDFVGFDASFQFIESLACV